MADGFIQAPADNTGKAADADVTTNSANLAVYRIKVNVPDGMSVTGDLLELLYNEMRTTNDLLAQAFGLGDDLDILRAQGDI